MKYYAYYRVSTQSQVEANGIGMQLDVVGRYINQNNIDIEAEYKDEGISGTIIDREGINELLSVLEKGDRIIVQNTSRLWRSDTVKVVLHHELKKIGVDIISVEQPSYSLYVTDPNDFLFNGMMELLDQYERMTIAMKLAKGRKAKAKNGDKPCGNAPYGYKWDNKEIKIDYNNNLVVIDIFEKYIELKSLEKLRVYCKSQGYKTSQGNEFSKQALKNIIENDFYIGTVTYANKQIKGNHPVFLDKDVFDKANAILKR